MRKPLEYRWNTIPYWPERLCEDALLVREAACEIGLSDVRLAVVEDDNAILEIEGESFRMFASEHSPQSPIYRTPLFCENRIGWLLRVVCGAPGQIDGYGIAQVRDEELYVYEVAVRQGSNRELAGCAILATLAAVATRIKRARVSAFLSRPDTLGAMLRLVERYGMYIQPERGFTLIGDLQDPDWVFISGQSDLVVERTHRLLKNKLEQKNERTKKA